MSKWYSFKELKRARTPMLLDSVTGLPDNHVITVVERVISVDDPELIQNNVRTDTFTLNLDAEYDDLNVVVIFTKPNNINVKVAYNGTPTHIPGSAMELVGSLACSVVGIDADGEVRAVTKAAPDTFQVVKSGAYDGSVTSDDAELLGQILQAVSDAEAAITEAETATTAATNATSQATSAATSANKAASSANSAASSANSAATRATSAAVNAENAYDTLQPYMATIDSCANILHREVGPDSVVTADDSFPCKPVEMVVYGNTVQNLWVNPSGTSSGVTATSNVDGSITLAGTSTAFANIMTSKIFTLKPGTQYTLSADKVPSSTAQALFKVRTLNDSNGMIKEYSATVDGTTFTADSGAVSAVCIFAAQSGTTVSGTYRVMLNEGSEAEPWCPPGLNSVGDDGSVKIVTAGKNYFPRMSSTTFAGITVTANSDGSYTLNGTSTATDAGVSVLNVDGIPKGHELTISSYGYDDTIVKVQISYDDVDGTMVYQDVLNKPKTFTIPESTRHINARVAVNKANNTVNNVTVYPQLELGSTATDYEPPNITTTTIDLQGHTLNSLPDGTRDELHIDGGGNVVLEKRVHREHIDADDFIAISGEFSDAVISTSINGAYRGGVTFRRSDQRNDFAPIGNADICLGYPKAAVYTLDNETTFRVGDGTQPSTSAEQLAGVKAKVGSKGIDAMWALLTPQTIDLGTITPPTMSAPNVTAYVADDTPAEMELDYVRDINIVVDRLEKKVADLVVTEATIV